jgi:multicomponent Na+:H+ antiporter subunit D
MAALLISSLVNAILFFRIIEIAYFEPKADHHAGDAAEITFSEAPFSMLVPLLVVAIGLIVIGLYSGTLVTTIIQHSVPTGL